MQGNKKPDIKMGLREKAVNGFAWTSVGTIGAGILNLIITLILARLLTPSDFGLIEILIIFTSISDIFVDSGFSQAVIRDKTATDKDLSSVFYFNILTAVIIYSVLFFGAPFIAQFYNIPSLTIMLRVVFLSLLFNSTSIIQNANFSRHLNFRPYALASVGAMIISGITAIIMAAMNYGIWALVVNLVLLSFFRMLFLWLQSQWRPMLVLSRTSIRRYFKFGSKLLIQGLTDRIITNIETLIIGKIYPKSDLGYFTQARKLDSYVLQTSTNVVQKVSYPILVSIGDDNISLKNGYRKVLGVTMFCITPVILFLISSAENVMGGLFGSKWLPSASYLRLWACCGWMVSLYTIFTNIYLVKAASGKLLKLSLIRQGLRILSILLLVRISITAMLWGIVIVTFVTGFMYIYGGGRQIGYSIKEIFLDMRYFVLFGIISGICTYLTGFILPQWTSFEELNLTINMLFQGGVYTLLYFSFNKITNNLFFIEVYQIIKQTLHIHK